MAPIRETYVPVPGLDYIEPLSERKSFAKHASSTANSQIPSTPSKRSKSKTTAEVEAQAKAQAKAKAKAKTKAEVESKAKAKAKSAEQPAKRRKSEQNSALDKTGDASTPIASKPKESKSDGYTLTKTASGTTKKAATASKTKEKPKPKPAVRPSNKFLSAELVTVSDDEDSYDGDMQKGDVRHVESNEKHRRRDNGGRIGGSARGDRSMGKTDERFARSTSRSCSEESGEESGSNINTNDNTGKNKKPGLSVRTNSAAPKRARSMSASTISTSDSSSESVHSHAYNDMPKKENGIGKVRSGKNDIVSGMQSAANGRPAKRAKSSSSSDASISSDGRNSAYSDEDKMDVDSSVAVGIGPSAQPKIKLNGTMFDGIGDRNGTRQAPMKQRASTPLLNGTRNTTSSSDSDSDSSSSNSQSDSEGNNAMDTSSDKHVPTTTATAKVSKSSKTTGAPIPVPKSRKPTSNSIRPVSTPALSTVMATPTTPAPHLNNTPTPTITTSNLHSTITPPPPPEPLSHSSLSPSNGKQIWHITLPANIPISSIQNIPLSAIASASASASASSTTSSTPIKNPRTTPITTHNGAEYILTAGSAAEEKDAHILVATTDRSNQGQHQHQHQDQQQHREIGYRRLARNVDAVWHVRLAPPTMPFASTRRGVTRRGADADADADADSSNDGSDGSDADGSDSSDSDDSNDAGNASSDDSEPCFRPLPPGLKMRWLPSGCVDEAS